MKQPILLLASLAILAGGADAADFGARSGPYLGEEPPGLEPRIFAPGLVSTGLQERDLLMAADGRTIWYGVMGGGAFTVLETRLENGAWTEPVMAGFHHDIAFACFEPTLSADGSRVLFLSNRAAPGQEQAAGWANQNIFMSRRTDDGWSPPEAVPAPITSAAGEFFPSLASDGTLYFTREDEQAQAVWAAEPAGDSWGEPVRLGPEVNLTEHVFNTAVAPDESWLVACVAGHEQNLGSADYWISFRDEDGSWLPAVNMGEPYNGPGQGARSVSLSPDGRYFFFSSNRTIGGERFPDGRVTRARLLELQTAPGGGSSDIWWVDAAALEALRP